MTRARLDPKSTAGADMPIERHVSLAVVGAGPAGLAAAITAAKAGVEVLLVDENPVSQALMGLDVPFHFGQRMNAAVQNKARMVERIVETNPGLAEAFELGIDVQLGVYAWGAFVKGPSLRGMAKPVLGLADEERSWLVSFDRLILATGARDLGLGFPGWEKPGVMGAQAALSLMQRYRAFEGRRLVILGSGALGLRVAGAALEQGLEIAGVVEVARDVLGPDALRPPLSAARVPFFGGHAVKQVLGKTEAEGVVLVRVGDDGAPIPGTERQVACDTVVSAIGGVPNVELMDVLGCRLSFDALRGGHVPVLDADHGTSAPCVQAVGDCAGVFDRKIADPELAVAEGRHAGVVAARALGAALAESEQLSEPGPSFDAVRHWQRWLQAALATGGPDVMVCQCEEVTRRELVELRPPRYLNWGGSQLRTRDVPALAKDGPVNADQVKRLTRAGMGTCQGRRCREQIQMLLAMSAGVPPEQIPLASYRAPVRPLPLSALWPHDETQETRDNWDVWFGIPAQWTAYWDMGAVSPAVPGTTEPGADSGK
ncbi:MAG TPA: NAD(P)/FAD-dependent oxidoreductase [Stellaceae bacterium]|nr:NAD(P)/FAD-dependent oxidoreductase [Stellaceae bacterium]